MEEEELSAEDLQSLYNLIPDGIFADTTELRNTIEGDSIGMLYPIIPSGMFKDEDDFINTFQGVKKKDDGQLDSALVPTSAEPMSVPVIGNITSEEEPESQEEPFFTGDFAWLDNTFIGDAIGDVAQQMQSGQAAGQSSSEALDLLLAGSNVSDEDLEEFMSQYGLSQSYGTSDEMLAFQQDAQDLGGGFAGTMLAGVKNPMAAVHMMASSMSQLANEKAAAVGGTIAASGLAGGGVGVGVSIPIAMGAAGGITETGMVFQELLIEELEAKGLDFNKENLRNILTDEEWFANARLTAIKKGGTTALIDMVGGTLTAGVGSTMTRGGRGAYKAAQELIEKGADVVDVIPQTATSGLRRAQGAAAVVGGDAVTGAASEAGGQLVAYGEVRGGEIAEEVIGGMGTSPTTIAAASLRGAKYKVNGKKVSRSELTEIMHGMNMYEISDAINDGQIEIQNDQGLLDLIYGDKKTRIPFEQASKEQSKASKAYDRAKKKYDKAVKSGDQAAIDEAEAERVTAFEALDNAAQIVAVEGKKIADSRNRKPPRTGVREEDDVPTPEEPTPPVKPEEPEVLTEAEQKLAEAKAKLEEQENLESASAERRQKALEESGRADEAATLQEKINNLQARLDRGLTKAGKPFTKKGKEGMQKQIDNRTAELKALYADVKIEEDVANVLTTSRSRAKAQAEVDRLQAAVDKEKSAKQADRTKTKEEKSLEDKLNRYGLRDNPNKPAKQIVINATKLDVDNPDKSGTFFKGFQVGSLLNHPVILQGFGRMGKKAFKGELRGFLRLRENGEVNFVTHNGRKTYVLGDVNKGFDIDAMSTDYFVAMDNSPVPSITEGGQVVVNGKTYRLAKEKQFFGIERYKNNNIKSMIVIDEDGKEVMLIDNGRFQSNKKPATAFSAEMAQWAEQQQKKRKGELESPEIVREEADDAAPPEGPPEDTTPDAEDPAPDRKPKVTVDPDERAEKLKQDGVYVGPVQGSNWVERNVTSTLERLRRNTLSSRGFFPASVQALRDFRDGRMNLHSMKAEKTAKAFEKEWNRMRRGMSEDQQKQSMTAMDALLRGENVDKVANGITSEMSGIISNMRNHIDAISQDMLDRGLIPDKNSIDPETQETYNSRTNIENNLGSYVSRTYELYDGKDWSSRVAKDTKNEAVKYWKERVGKDKNVAKLYERWASGQKENNPSVLLEEWARKQVENLLAQDAETLAIAGASTKTDAVSRTPLMRRQDIDPRIRALMGERTNPMTNYMVTVGRSASLAERSRFLYEVRDMGLKMGWLFEGTSPIGVEGFDTNMDIPNMSNDLNPFVDRNGKSSFRTTPEIAKAFQEQPNWFDRNIAGNPLGKIFGIAKWNKTVGSATTHARNIIGNVSFVMANGHLDARSAGTSFTEIMDPSPAGYNRLVELGVVGQQSNRQEIVELMNSGNVLEAMANRYGKSGSPFANWMTKSWNRTGGKMTKLADTAYQAEDDFFKIYGFEIEKGRYAKAMFNSDFKSLSQEQQLQVEEKAASIIKDIYPNYNRIGPLIKGISKFPVVGTFLAFRAESFRVSFNIMRQAMAEIQDPSTREIGAKRLAGISAYLGGKAYLTGQYSAAAGYGIAGLVGGKQEDEEGNTRQSDYDDITKFIRPWEKAGYKFRDLGGLEDVSSDQLIIENIDREKGIIKYRNLSTVDGFSDPTAVFQRMLAGAEGRGQISDNRVVDAFVGGLIELVGPFVEEEMTTQLINEFTNNAKPNGSKIWNTNDPVDKQLMDGLDYWYRLMPSVFAQSKKLAEGGYGETFDEAFLGIIGLGTQEIDVAEQFRLGTLSDYKEQIKQERGIRFKADEYTEGNLDDVVDVYTDRMKVMYTELSEYAQSAMNLGVPEYKIQEALESRLGGLGMSSKVLSYRPDGSTYRSDLTPFDLIVNGDFVGIEAIAPDYVRDRKEPTE